MASELDMDEIYQNIAQIGLKGFSFSADSTVKEFQVNELWRHDVTGMIRPVQSDIKVSEVSTWLARETQTAPSSASTTASSQETSASPAQPADNESLVLRLVLVPVDFDKRKIKLEKSARKEILSNFDLELAYLYSTTRVAGVNAFSPTVIGGKKRQSFAFTYAPKLAAIWSHTHPEPGDSRHGITRGVILAQQDQIKSYCAILKPKWSPAISSHPMFPAFLTSLVMSYDIDEKQLEVKRPIQQVEARTGYTKFKTERPMAFGELGQLSADMSGLTNTLASANRSSQTIQRLTDFIKEMSIQGGITITDPTLDGNSVMNHHMGVIQERLAMQTIDREFTMKRLQLQREALVSLIAQTDSVNNMDIALSSHRDASSMKTLAFVTMLFLPGSFIAALFSTECFDWDGAKENSISVPETPQFKLYWAITVPLTLMTFISYFAWLRFSSWQRHKQRDDNEGLNRQPDHGDDKLAESIQSQSRPGFVSREVAKLARRRQTMT